MKTQTGQTAGLKLGIITSALLLCSGTLGANPVGDNDNKAWSMASRIYADRKAGRIGDIVTVAIQETSESAKNAKTSTKKSSSASGSASATMPMKGRTFSWGTSSVPAWQLDTSQSFDGGGSTANKDSFLATISVTVRDVLPNGNLLIEGTRSVVIRDDRVTIVLSGMVRPEDIDSDNTVLSTKIADAAVRYSTTGTLASSQEQGLFLRLINWLNPF